MNRASLSGRHHSLSEPISKHMYKRNIGRRKKERRSRKKDVKIDGMKTP
jgi:hypothetical protein